MKKELKRSDDLYFQFTDEELKQLNIEPKDKFSIKLNEDNSITLEKFVKMEIDISDWDRNILEMLIKESIEQDISVNDVINDLLIKQLSN